MSSTTSKIKVFSVLRGGNQEYWTHGVKVVYKQVKKEATPSLHTSGTSYVGRCVSAVVAVDSRASRALRSAGEGSFLSSETNEARRVLKPSSAPSTGPVPLPDSATRRAWSAPALSVGSLSLAGILFFFFLARRMSQLATAVIFSHARTPPPLPTPLFLFLPLISLSPRLRSVTSQKGTSRPSNKIDNRGTTDKCFFFEGYPTRLEGLLGLLPHTNARHDWQSRQPSQTRETPSSSPRPGLFPTFDRIDPLPTIFSEQQDGDEQRRNSI